MVKPPPPPQKNTLFNYMPRTATASLTTPTTPTPTTTKTTTTADSFINNNISSTSDYNSSAVMSLSTTMDDSTLYEHSQKSPKVSHSSSPGLIQSLDNPISPGGDSGSNISIPSFSTFSPERQKQLSDIYLMGYHRATAKLKDAIGGATIPSPLDVVSGGEVVEQGKYHVL